MLIDDKDLNIDIECETTSLKASMTQAESNSKKKSQSSYNDDTKKKKKKTNGSAGKRRKSSRKEKEEALVIEKLSPSSWVTLDSSITADISPKYRELIEFYVNPLHAMPNTLDVG